VALAEHHLEPLRDWAAGRTVCVTGGAGFIGSHIVDALLTLGGHVRVIDDLSASDPERISLLVAQSGGRLVFTHASILDPDALAETVRGSSTVFHLAAMGSVPKSIDDPARCYAVNVTGTLRVAEAARSAGVERLVFSASSSAYGDAERMPLSEDMPPRPLSPYAASKLAGEHTVRAYAHSMNLPGVSLRYFNVFGPRQRADADYAAVIPAFASRIAKGERPVIYGDGAVSRDFCSVDNVVIANLLAASGASVGAGETINIACGQSTTIGELARTIAELSGRPDIEPVFEDPRAGDVPASLADLSRARDLLGYEVVTPFRQGLAETVESFLAPTPNA
jgi:nucleoside-diphosphate-sugar epimerase